MARKYKCRSVNWAHICGMTDCSVRERVHFSAQCYAANVKRHMNRAFTVLTVRRKLGKYVEYTVTPCLSLTHFFLFVFIHPFSYRTTPGVHVSRSLTLVIPACPVHFPCLVHSSLETEGLFHSLCTKAVHTSSINTRVSLLLTHSIRSSINSEQERQHAL